MRNAYIGVVSSDERGADDSFQKCGSREDGDRAVVPQLIRIAANRQRHDAGDADAGRARAAFGRVLRGSGRGYSAQ